VDGRITRDYRPVPNRIAFIGCSKNKQNHPCKASDLYRGDLFRKSLQYCIQEQFEEIYILSAKYGLLHIDRIVEPYDLTLNSFSISKRKRWADHVKKQIEREGLSGEFWFFCGSRYHEFFEGVKPFDKMSLGFQLQWLKKNLKRRGGFL